MEMTSASLSSTSPAAQIALQYIGSAYVFGGNGPSGFDCSGFVEYVMRQIGRNVPRDLAGQYAAGYHPQGAPEPGDLVFFQDTYDYGLSHVGIYIGNGNFIHAISEASGVGISNMNEPYYVERLYGVTRLPDSVK
jgi:cell wall-associated NlpC family hydrolase